MEWEKTAVYQFCKIPGREFYFEAASPGTDKNGIKALGRVIDKGSQLFLLSQGADTTRT